MTPEERWQSYMGTGDKRMFSEEESQTVCPRCKRLESLLLNIEAAWKAQWDHHDGYDRLKFAIEAARSETLRERYGE